MEGAIKYKITVVATVERVEVCGKEWQRQTAEDNSKYAYTPEIEKTVRRDVEVYQQTVDSLDLVEVICAVNSITPSTFVRKN